MLSKASFRPTAILSRTQPVVQRRTLQLFFNLLSAFNVTILSSLGFVMDVYIDVEYCASCGHKKQFLEMAALIKSKVPNANVRGSAGRQASFEVEVNGELVYSKLQTMAFPNFAAVSELAEKVRDGKPVRKIDQRQPVDCAIS